MWHAAAFFGICAVSAISNLLLAIFCFAGSIFSVDCTLSRYFAFFKFPDSILQFFYFVPVKAVTLAVYSVPNDNHSFAPTGLPFWIAVGLLSVIAFAIGSFAIGVMIGMIRSRRSNL